MGDRGRIGLVVFDAGGVLVRLASFWDGVLARAGLTLAIDPTEAAFAERHAATSAAHQRGEIDLPTYRERVAAATGLTPKQVQALLDAHLVDEFEGIGHVIDRLERAGVATALLSNTNAYHWSLMLPDPPAIGRFPSVRRLRHAFGSHLLGVMKPDPAIYLAVEDATGWRGSAVLFFDDLPANVDAAKALGWQAVQIDPAADPARQILDILDPLGILDHGWPGLGSIGSSR